MEEADDNDDEDIEDDEDYDENEEGDQELSAKRKDQVGSMG